MTQKLVTPEIAKVLKEAGYPQDIHDSTIFIECDVNKMQEALVLPTYLDVWIWLYRERNFVLEFKFTENAPFNSPYIWENRILKCFGKDPEETLVGAIDYLIGNELI